MTAGAEINSGMHGASPKPVTNSSLGPRSSRMATPIGQQHIKYKPPSTAATKSVSPIARKLVDERSEKNRPTADRKLASSVSVSPDAAAIAANRTSNTHANSQLKASRNAPH